MSEFLRLVVLSLALAAGPAWAWEGVDGNADLKVIIDCLAARGDSTIYLRHMSQSGFKQILGNYLGQQPLTLLVPTDDAFRSLPGRIKGRLTGPQRIKFLEFHMLKQWFPADYIRGVLDSAFFETVLSDPNLGPFIHKAPLEPGDDPTKIIRLAASADKLDTVRIVDPDACGRPTPTVGVQMIDRVLIPPGVFDTATH